MAKTLKLNYSYEGKLKTFGEYFKADQTSKTENLILFECFEDF